MVTGEKLTRSEVMSSSTTGDTMTSGTEHRDELAGSWPWELG
jgi:hypothetical protein